MQSVRGQAIAVGNLGMLALLKADSLTARTCFEQVIQIYQYKFNDFAT
jgi:Flp pilus assembly protein TadD